MSRRPVILICAPDEELRATLRAALTASDQEVREAASPTEAVTALGESGIDLIIAEGGDGLGGRDGFAHLLVRRCQGGVERGAQFLVGCADQDDGATGHDSLTGSEVSG